ncbi:MAG: DEAD/DEAH box helicase [Planctomycetes bacterium]|nr:DEAD/DEAH box helicase [Planctomycetota bacterium]
MDLTFADMALRPELKAALAGLGFVKPTPIQAEAIPYGLAGRDILGKAQTGTGKTLAFGLPLVERLDPTRVAAQALVLLPTRELAQQVSEHLAAVATPRGLKVALIVGGEKIRFQLPRIPGSHIIVGTPGRVLDLLKERMLHIEWAECLVLDEFDRMLDMGFIDDVKSIVAFMPKERQTMLFSATVPPEIRKLTTWFLRDAKEIVIEQGLRPAARAEQRALRVAPRERLEILLRLIGRELHEDPERTVLVFANTRIAVAELDRELFGRGLPAAALSGDFEQSRRFAVMDGFREKRIRVLVATDVASRGLDVDHVGHVINFDVPLEVEDYIHRIGRTARAGRSGVVTTFVIPLQERKFLPIAEAMGSSMKIGSVRLPPGSKMAVESFGHALRSARAPRGGPRSGERSSRGPRDGARRSSGTRPPPKRRSGR